LQITIKRHVVFFFFFLQTNIHNLSTTHKGGTLTDRNYRHEIKGHTHEKEHTKLQHTLRENCSQGVENYSSQSHYKSSKLNLVFN